MNSDMVIEAVGYLASALIVISITQKSILRLRLIGLLGSVVFLVYSLVIDAYPIAVVNVIAAGIHLWYLRRLMGRKNEVFHVLHVQPDSDYLLDFLNFYGDEISGLVAGGFTYEPRSDLVTAFVLRDMVPAGLFIGEAQDDGSFQVKLDFVIPQYRDFRIGRYVYSPASGLFADAVPTCVWTDASDPVHRRYFRRMGFRESAERPGRYEIRLASPPTEPSR